MLYRSKNLSSKSRNFSTPTLRPTQRLIFPSKQLHEGYVGKKQFIYQQLIQAKPQSAFKVQTAPQNSQNDRYNANEIQGSRPKIRNQMISNVERGKRNQESKNIQNYTEIVQINNQYQNRRIKTQVQDSLDHFMQNSTKKRDSRPKMHTEVPEILIESPNKNKLKNSYEIQKMLTQKNMQLNKRNILGIDSSQVQPIRHPNQRYSNKIVNPTYLSTYQMLF